MNINKKLIKYFFVNTIINVVNTLHIFDRKVVIFLDHPQYFPLIQPLIKEDPSLFRIYTTHEEVKSFLRKQKIPYINKVGFCQGIVFLCNYSKKDDIGSLNKFFYNKKIKKFQLFHGITDGIDDYTYENHLLSYDLIFCSGKYRFNKFIEKGFPREKLRLVGFPKLQSATISHISNQVFSHDIKKQKKVILFAPTWGLRSSFSLLTPDLLNKLIDRYEVLFSLHRMHIDSFKKAIKSIKNIQVLGDDELLEGMKRADVLISDVSSAIYEFLIFDKPIVMINMPWNDYFSKKEKQSAFEYKHRDDIAFCINTAQELESKIELAINNPLFHSRKRGEVLNEILFIPKLSLPTKLIVQEIINVLH